MQKLVAEHPNITTFPESHFFTSLHRHGGWQWGIPFPKRHRAKETLKAFLENIDRSDLIPGLNVLNRKWTRASYGRFFVSLLDRLAQERKYTTWLEKTPMHLHFIPAISRIAPDARFIHIIREGLHTIASVYAVTNAHPGGWGGRRSLEDCIARWKMDIDLSIKWLGHKGHHFVRYETLVKDPDRIMQDVFGFLDMKYQSRSDLGITGGFDQIQTPGEVWKQDVFKPLNDIDRDKRIENLSHEQVAYVMQNISNTDLTLFEKQTGKEE